MARTSPDIVLGVDPGASGAVSGLNLHTGALEFTFSMPVRYAPSTARKSGHIKTLDLEPLAALIKPYAAHTAVAMVESPGAMPKQGLSSTFNFGRSCGHIEGILAALGINQWLIKPAAWKMALGLSRNKDASMEMATMLWPDMAHNWKLKKHNDRCEAALIAHYGLRYLKPIVDIAAELKGCV